MKEYEVVELTVDLPAEGLVRGQRGFVLEIYDDVNCEVEFSDNEGITIFLGALPMNILKVTS